MAPERRAQLVFFDGVAREQPHVMAAILGSYTSHTELIDEAGRLDPPTEDASYNDRAIAAAGSFFAADLDLDTIPDAETVARMHSRLEDAERAGTLARSRRLLRVAEFALQIAAWQEQQEISAIADHGAARPA